jgi:drug/metabolite transporter (DMT)-like permease
MLGEIAALGTAFLWSLTSIMIRDAVHKVGPVSVNAVRVCTGAAIFVAILLFTGRVAEALTTPWTSVAVLVVSIAIGLGLGDTAYFQSLRLIGVSRALPISGSYPLLTVVLAAAFLGEPLDWYDGLGTVLVVASVWLLSLPETRGQAKLKATSNIRTGVLLAVFAAATWAVSTIGLKLGAEGIDLVIANGIRLPAAAILMVATTLRRGGGLRLRDYDMKTAILVGISGVTGTALGSFLYLAAIMYAGAGRTAALQATSPFFAAPLAFFFFRERIPPTTIVGMVLSVAGVWLIMGL